MIELFTWLEKSPNTLNWVIFILIVMCLFIGLIVKTFEGISAILESRIAVNNFKFDIKDLKQEHIDAIAKSAIDQGLLTSPELAAIEAYQRLVNEASNMDYTNGRTSILEAAEKLLFVFKK